VWCVDGLAVGDEITITAEDGTTEKKVVATIDTSDVNSPKLSFETGLENTYPEDTTVTAAKTTPKDCHGSADVGGG
ncbi:unnamed protein product, partial [Prorocentrum cordatum]